MLSPVDILKAPFRFYKRSVWKVGPMAANPYATHIPVLVACAQLFRPASVLELGSGDFSTPLFLNREIFSEVTHLCSLENNADWFRHMEHVQDPRLERVLIKGSISEALETFDCTGFDLIFVDDSSHAKIRRRTLGTLRKKITSQIVVIHDVDQWRVRLGACSLPRHHEMRGITPQSAIAWNSRPVAKQKLAEADEIMRIHKHRISEEHALLWRDLFRQLA